MGLAGARLAASLQPVVRRVTTRCSMGLAPNIAINQAGYLDHIHNGFVIDPNPLPETPCCYYLSVTSSIGGM